MGSSGCEVAGGGKDQSLFCGSVFAEGSARGRTKRHVLFKILAGSSACVVRPGTKNVVEAVD